jgi:hypothetical protein
MTFGAILFPVARNYAQDRWATAEAEVKRRLGCQDGIKQSLLCHLLTPHAMLSQGRF